jgi:hypothetical protein
MAHRMSEDLAQRIAVPVVQVLWLRRCHGVPSCPGLSGRPAAQQALREGRRTAARPKAGGPLMMMAQVIAPAAASPACGQAVSGQQPRQAADHMQAHSLLPCQSSAAARPGKVTS